MSYSIFSRRMESSSWFSSSSTVEAHSGFGLVGGDSRDYSTGYFVSLQTP